MSARKKATGSASPSDEAGPAVAATGGSKPPKGPTAVFETIEVPPLEIATVTIAIRGLTPLIMHAWSEKAKSMMRDKQQKKATKGRETRNPEQEFIDATYFIERDKDGPDRYGFPALAFKSAMVDAGMTTTGKKAPIRRAFHVVADATSLQNGPLVEIFPEHAPRMREDMVRVGMGTADLRYRPQFEKWSANLTIRYDKKQISPSQLINLVNNAGFSCGIGDWRVEKDGESGQFEAVGITGS